MEMYATMIYVISDEILRSLKIKDDPQVNMNNAEVITFSILSAKFFYSNFHRARIVFKKLKFFDKILSESRLNRRIHSIPWHVWNSIFRFLALIFNQTNTTGDYAVDSFPVSCCEKNRIDKRKIFLERTYIGYAPSKKRYFCGIKVHMIVTGTGQPVEVQIRPGSESDSSVLWEMELDIPEYSKLYADGAYNCFDLEDVLKDDNIELLAKRGSKAKKRVRSTDKEREISSKRQIVETAFIPIVIQNYGFWQRERSRGRPIASDLILTNIRTLAIGQPRGFLKAKIRNLESLSV